MSELKELNLPDIREAIYATSGRLSAAEKYIEMLKQGRTKKSVELLKMVGVDLESQEPYQKAFDFYKENIEELEKIVNNSKHE